jgi:hypothetical protein
MSRVFDYNGSIVASSNPVKHLRTVKRSVVIDSGDRDVKKHPKNNDVTIYLPRVYENVVSIRLMAAEFPGTGTVLSSGAAVDSKTLYYLVDIEGLNKTDECSPGADRSGFPDGHFAKIPIYNGTTSPVFYSDNSSQTNIAAYSPPIGKLDRMRVRVRTHLHKSTGDSVYFSSNGEWSMTFEIETLENAFDNFSSIETRVVDRAK